MIEKMGYKPTNWETVSPIDKTNKLNNQKHENPEKDHKNRNKTENKFKKIFDDEFNKLDNSHKIEKKLKKIQDNRKSNNRKEPDKGDFLDFSI